jgi:hypothetical protein
VREVDIQISELFNWGFHGKIIDNLGPVKVKESVKNSD